MSSEIRTCQNCKTEFVVEPEDFKFYEKIKVPPPTWCPECRMVRRMNFRNERTLYKRKCSLCEKEIISMHPEGTTFPVYCHDCWFSDAWDALKYGVSYSEGIPFFHQIHNLMLRVPRIALEGYQNVNSEYVNFVWFSKKVYLSPSTIHSENISYSKSIYHSKDVIDSVFVHYSELCYEGINGQKCHSSSYLLNSHECIDSRFLFDCIGCQNCFMSSNLRHQNYVFRNRKVSPGEYKKLMQTIDLGSNSQREALLEEFHLLVKNALHRFATIRKSVNSTGDIITNSKNAYYCFDVEKVEDVRYFTQGLDIKDSMDLFGAGDGAEFLYDGVNVGYKDSKVLFSAHTFDGCLDVQYCDYCRHSQSMFGCVGLRNKSYCILNKQYAKEEYEKLVPRIIEHMNNMPYMDRKGRIYKYGEFFPPELSPFAYNETIAEEYFPLTKDEALERGYSWKDPEPRNYQITLKTEDIPDHIKDVKDSILNDIIQCAHWPLGHAMSKCNEQCTQAYKIIPQELDFLRKMNLPLPRLCPNCRHYQRIKQRNPLKLWHRKCQCVGLTSENKIYQNTTDHIHHKKDQPCPNEFETTYAPERPEIVYCEACYIREVV